MSYGHVTSYAGTARKDRDIYLRRFIDRYRVQWIQNFNLSNIIATLSFYFFGEKFVTKCH